MASDLPPLYAHRLGRAYGPDSSAAALAGTLGGPGRVCGLETDVCLTSDGGLVLLHDPLLTLGTTLDGWAHQRTAAAIVSARIRDARGAPSAQRPLLLEELLPDVPAEMGLQLEVKSHADPELADRTAAALVDILAGHPLRDRTEVISFHPGACAVAAAGGLRARLVIWASYAPDALASWALGAGVAGVSIEHFLLSEQLVGVLREAGLSINTGTVNRVELLRRALEFGPDAIGTDRPHELAAEFAAATSLAGVPAWAFRLRAPSSTPGGSRSRAFGTRSRDGPRRSWE
jgi:glycerophosphoryl diester phosphodiesterase